MWADRVRDLLEALWGIRLWLILGVVLVGVAHYLYFIVLPSRLMKRAGPGEQDRSRKYLEGIAATPSLMGRGWKLPARLYILQCHIQQGRHAEAVRTCRSLLTWRLSPSLESTTRHHLADSLEALKDPEAAEQRRAARDCLKGTEPDALSCLATGRLLVRENRHEEAYDQFVRGLDLTEDGASRAEFLMNMALSAFNAGRIEDSARHAQEAVEAGAQGTQLRLAHRHAGVSLANLGRHQESETHRRAALEVARAQGDAKHVSDSMADLAEILRKQGRLDEAIRDAEEAVAIDPEGARHALTVQYEAMKNLGDFDRARALLEKARATAPLVIPHYERRMQAVYDMGRAWIALDQGRADEAREFVRKAAPVLADDAKLKTWLDSAHARIAALKGDHAAYADSAERVEHAIEALAGDRSSLKGALTSLGKAAVAIGDFEYARGCWDRFLDLDPEPVERPMLFYHLGLCHQGLDRPDLARDAFGRSVSEAVTPAHYSRMASDRLRALGPA